MKEFEPIPNRPAYFEGEIEEEGYAIFSKVKNRKAGYYPSEFPDFDDIDIEEVKEDEIYTIRAFFQIGKSNRIDGGLINVKIEGVEKDIIWANILSILPESFPLQQGSSIDLSIDELLYLTDY